MCQCERFPFCPNNPFLSSQIFPRFFSSHKYHSPKNVSLLQMLIFTKGYHKPFLTALFQWFTHTFLFRRTVEWCPRTTRCTTLTIHIMWCRCPMRTQTLGNSRPLQRGMKYFLFISLSLSLVASLLFNITSRDPDIQCRHRPSGTWGLYRKVFIFFYLHLHVSPPSFSPFLSCFCLLIFYDLQSIIINRLSHRVMSLSDSDTNPRELEAYAERYFNLPLYLFLSLSPTSCL